MQHEDNHAYACQLASKARLASFALRQCQTAAKNQWLSLVCHLLEHRTAEILAANAIDLQSAVLSSAMRDRLTLTTERVNGIIESLRQVIALPDPVDEVREETLRPNGLLVRKVGVPLGVVLFIYESRPNVTVDAAALCVKSGNCVILRGGKEAATTNALLAAILRTPLEECGLPGDAVLFVDRADRDVVGTLLKCQKEINLVIPRGGESLIRRVVAEATMPVLKHDQGNCHVYVDADADLTIAMAVLVNAKCQRPGVCNATESLLVHEAVAESYLQRLAPVLQQRGVELRGCEVTRRIVPGIRLATVEDYGTEYLDLILSVKVVSSLVEAVEHIRRYGSGHTEAILTENKTTAKTFSQSVDAATVMVNASTRFNDGFELGLGAEIGISTDKFHARGPCGLRELTTYQYVVLGTGQIRS